MNYLLIFLFVVLSNLNYAQDTTYRVEFPLKKDPNFQQLGPSIKQRPGIFDIQFVNKGSTDLTVHSSYSQIGLKLLSDSVKLIKSGDSGVFKFKIIYIDRLSNYQTFTYNGTRLNLYFTQIPVDSVSFIELLNKTINLEELVVSASTIDTFYFVNNTGLEIQIVNILRGKQNAFDSILSYSNGMLDPGDTGFVKIKIFAKSISPEANYNSIGVKNEFLLVFNNQSLNIKISQKKNIYLKDAPIFKWIDSTTHNLKEVVQGIPVETTYYFVNVGGSPLIISQVQSTCGCIVNDWIKTSVMPYDTGWVVTHFNAANTGSFAKANTVISNSITPNVKLFIKGIVVSQKPELIWTEWEHTYFGKLKQDTIYNHRAYFINKGFAPLILYSVTSNNEMVDFALDSDEIEYLDSGFIDISLKTVNAGTFKSWITIEYCSHQFMTDIFGLNQHLLYVYDTTHMVISGVVLDKSGYADILWKEPVNAYTHHVEVNYNSVNDTIGYTFVFTNTGTSTLIIDSVIPMKNPVDITISKSSILPGDSAWIQVKVKKIVEGEYAYSAYGCTVYTNAIFPVQQVYISSRRKR